MDTLSVRAYLRTYMTFLILIGCLAGVHPLALAQAPVQPPAPSPASSPRLKHRPPAVNIVVDGTGRGTATDRTGRYEIANLALGVLRRAGRGYLLDGFFYVTCGTVRGAACCCR
jgi:hypothetical protein